MSAFLYNNRKAIAAISFILFLFSAGLLGVLSQVPMPKDQWGNQEPCFLQTVKDCCVSYIFCWLLVAGCILSMNEPHEMFDSNVTNPINQMREKISHKPDEK